MAVFEGSLERGGKAGPARGEVLPKEGKAHNTTTEEKI